VENKIFIGIEELIKVFSDAIEKSTVIEFKFEWISPSDKVNIITFSPYLVSKKVLGKVFTYGYDHLKKEFSTYRLDRISSYQLKEVEFYKEKKLEKYKIDYEYDEVIIKSIPELKFDHSLKRMTFKLKPEEKQRQDEIFKLLYDCIDNKQVILMTIKWDDRTQKKILFNPYLIGEDFINSTRGLFVYGKDIIAGKNRTHYFKLFKGIEVGVSHYSTLNTTIEYWPHESVVIKRIQELQILEHPKSQDKSKHSYEVDDWVEPDYINKPCMVCGSFENCKHFTFLNQQYKAERSNWEKSKEYSQLFYKTIEHHQKFDVIPYFTKDENEVKRFSQIKRKKWTENYFSLIGEWSQSPMHSGYLNFDIKSTKDKKYWALFQRGFPSRIYEIAEIVDDGDVVMEKVAGGMMSVFTKFEGVNIECRDIIGEVNLSLLYDLYNFYNERFENDPPKLIQHSLP